MIQKSRYGRFFLNDLPGKVYTEADDEEEETDNTDEEETTDDTDTSAEDTPPADEETSEETPNEAEGDRPVYNKNTRVIEVKPDNRSRLKFEDDLTPEDEESEDGEGDESSGEEPDILPDLSDETIGDEGDDGIEFNDDSTTDNGEESIDDSINDEEGFDTAIDGEDTPPGEEQPPEEPDTGSDDESFEDSGNEDAPEGEEPPAEGEKKGPGLEFDSTRKYNLLKNFVSLSNAISNYISKLENNLGEDLLTNQVYKKSTEKLREILELCNDYMIMKFELSTYVQSLLFFQNLVIMVQMTFDLIAKHTQNKKKENK